MHTVTPIGQPQQPIGVYLPPAGQSFFGVGPGTPNYFESEVQSHVAVLDDFITWQPGASAGSFNWFLARADQNHMRAMVSIITNYGRDTEYLTPGAAARGEGDTWMIGLGQALATRGLPTYVRLWSEMDGWWNPYAAYNEDGSP